MVAKYFTTNRQLTFEITGETQQDLFEGVSAIQEVFDTETSCGVCNNDKLRFQHRIVQKYHFHELVCRNPECRARFSFGHSQDDKGALFPKRKNKDGEWLPNRGWEKYTAPSGGNSTGNRQSNQSQDWE